VNSLAPAAGFDQGRVETSISAGWRGAAYALILIGAARLVGSTSGAFCRNDFAHYYLAGRTLLAGEDPYTTPLEPLCQQYGLEYDARIPFAANPPLLNRLAGTIAWQGAPAAYMLWATLEAFSLVLLLASVRRLLGADARDARWLLVAGVTLNATCLQRQFFYSQVQIVVAASLAAALVLHTQGRRASSCALAALVAAIKVFPAALVPWFLFADLRGARDLFRRGVAVAGVGGAVLAVTGIEAWRRFAVDGLPVIERSVQDSTSNYSLPSLANKVAGAAWGRPLPEGSAPVVRLCGVLLSTAALMSAYLVVWRRRLEPIRALGVLAAATIAASPVCWSHYFVLMILPVALLWRLASEPLAHTGRWKPIAAGALCLWPELDFPVPWSDSLPRIALHFYPLAALGAVAVLLIRYGKAPGRVDARPDAAPRC
jgi:hypothetical protein